MTHSLLSLVLILLLNVGVLRAKEAPVKSKAIEVAGALVELPEGWSVEKETAAAQPWIRLHRGRHEIGIRVFGGPTSRYATPAAFLDSFEARTKAALADKVGKVRVLGVKTVLYRRGYPVDLGDPHATGGPEARMAREDFCLAPAGKRFYVLSHSDESHPPDPEKTEEKDFQRLLRSFRLK